MKSGVVLLFVVVTAWSNGAFASMSIGPGRSALVVKNSYTTVLPEPFGVTEIQFGHSDNYGVTWMRVFTKGEILTFSPELIEGLSMLDEPGIRFNGADFDKTRRIDKFELLFSSGPEFLIEFPNESVPVGQSSKEWMRASVAFSIDENLLVDRKWRGEDEFRRLIERREKSEFKIE